MGRVKITVKTKETKHYKAGSKTVTVKVKDSIEMDE